RDEPVPKLGPATSIVAPAYSGLFSTKSLSSRHSEKRPCPNPVRSTFFSQDAGIIWSVSTSLRSSGTARPVMTLTGFIGDPPGKQSGPLRLSLQPPREIPDGSGLHGLGVLRNS